MSAYESEDVSTPHPYHLESNNRRRNSSNNEDYVDENYKSNINLATNGMWVLDISVIFFDWSDSNAEV